MLMQVSRRRQGRGVQKKAEGIMQKQEECAHIDGV